VANHTPGEHVIGLLHLVDQQASSAALVDGTIYVTTLDPIATTHGGTVITDHDFCTNLTELTGNTLTTSAFAV
jgi:hypothetical protein